MPLSRNLGTLTSWNPLGHSRPVTELLYLCMYRPGDRGNTVVKMLCYKSEGRLFDFGVIGIFVDIKSFWSHYGPGVDSTSNRNEYQEYFLGVKTAGVYGWQPYHHPVPLSRKLGNLTSWNPLGHSRPVTGLLYLCMYRSTRRQGTLKPKNASRCSTKR